MSDLTRWRELTYDETEGLGPDELYLCQDTTGGWVRASSHPLVPDSALQDIADAWQNLKDRKPRYQVLYYRGTDIFNLLDGLVNSDCTHGLTLSNGPREVCAECGKVVNDDA